MLFTPWAGCFGYSWSTVDVYIDQPGYYKAVSDWYGEGRANASFMAPIKDPDYTEPFPAPAFGPRPVDDSNFSLDEVRYIAAYWQGSMNYLGESYVSYRPREGLLEGSVRHDQGDAAAANNLRVFLARATTLDVGAADAVVEKYLASRIEPSDPESYPADWLKLRYDIDAALPLDREALFSGPGSLTREEYVNGAGSGLVMMPTYSDGELLQQSWRVTFFVGRYWINQTNSMDALVVTAADEVHITAYWHGGDISEANLRAKAAAVLEANDLPPLSLEGADFHARRGRS